MALTGRYLGACACAAGLRDCCTSAWPLRRAPAWAAEGRAKKEKTKKGTR